MAAQVAQVYQILSPVLQSLMAAVEVEEATDSQVLRAVQVAAVRVGEPTTVMLLLQVLPTQAAAQVVELRQQRVVQALQPCVTLAHSVARAVRSLPQVGTQSTRLQRPELTAHRRKLWAVM
jgi:hypothetical protein